MGILLVPYPARGHVGPFLAVAAELVRRGRDVRIVVPWRYAGAARAAGAVPLVPADDRDVVVPAGWRPGDFAKRARARADRHEAARDVRVEFRRALGEQRPSLVVVDPHARWARMPLGVRSAWLWTTSPWSSAGHEPLLVNGLPQLGAGGRRVAGRIRFIGPLLGGLSTPGPDLPRARPAGRRLAVVSFGTVFERKPDWLRAVAESFRGSEWLIVLATGSAAELGVLPENVVASRSIPQRELLRHAEVVVTHGGMNSVLEAAAAGVPMLLRPRIREQRKTAAAVIGLGAGALMGPVHRVRAQVEVLAGRASVAERARELRDLVRAAPGAAEAAGQVINLAVDRVTEPG